jgi:CheY-like chemotaxis protein
VLLNLAVNARDAMPGGGHLTIESRRAELDGTTAIMPGVIPAAGSYVCISVEDEGTGMDPETARRVFEPYFTTKPNGRGTGLGLATTYGIVRQSGGYIGFHTALGRGTRFEIYLPETHALADRARPGSPKHEVRGSETILILEDQATLRRALARNLRGLGYHVLEAGSAAEAREVATTKRVEVIISDLLVPGGGVLETVATLCNEHSCSAIYMSAFVDPMLHSEAQVPEDAPFLQKPFTPDALARAVRETLGGRPGQAAQPAA